MAFGGTLSGAENFPTAEITNGEIRAKIYLPDAQKGFYRSTRFDWSGVIGSLEYKGDNYYGPWLTKITDVYDFGYEGEDVTSAPFTAMVRPGEEFAVMGCDTVLAIEPFTPLAIAPREEFTWDVTYDYYTLPDSKR